MTQPTPNTPGTPGVPGARDISALKTLEVELSNAGAARSLEWYRKVHGLRSEIEVHTVLRHLRLGASHRVLDVGCGAGRVSLAIAPRARAVTCIDIAPANIRVLDDEAQRRGLKNLTARALDANELVPDSEPFDRAVAVESIQHIPDAALRLDAVRRIRACLRPGGRFVKVAYRWGGAITGTKDGTHEDGRYRFAYTPDELRQLLTDAGFRDVFVGGCVNVPYRLERIASYAPWVAVRADAALSHFAFSARRAHFLIASATA